jgi:ABC-type iron transport system FetAB ATPase subunit
MDPVENRLVLENVSAGYNGQRVLHDLTLQVVHGGQVAVVGPNGAGKSTLFKVLVGLLPLRSGQILIHGQPLGEHKDCVAYVPQRSEVDWRFPLTVMDVVMMGRYNRQGWLRRPDRDDRAAVQHALEQMGIADLARRAIGNLSGGQQQRVFLARALATALLMSGAAVFFLSSGDLPALAEWAGGVVFVTTLALALGVFSSGSRVFEVVYVIWWYIGPLQKMPGMDFTTGALQIYLLAAAGCCCSPRSGGAGRCGCRAGISDRKACTCPMQDRYRLLFNHFTHRG